MYVYFISHIFMCILLFYMMLKEVKFIKIPPTGKSMSLSCHYSYLVDPASSDTLVLKIKPCMSKYFVIITLDCRRLIITVIVLLRLFYRWIPVEILELIHVTINIFFYIFSIYFLSNQNASAFG